MKSCVHCTSLMRCVNSSEWRNCEPHLISPRQMGWLRDLIKPLWGWLGSWEKTNNSWWARTSGWNSAHLQCHPICHDRVQPTLFNVWTQAKAPSQLLLPHFKKHRGPQERCLHQACGWICSHCLRPIEGHPSRGPDPVYSRGSETEVVLGLENRYCRFEAWWSCLSQGRCLSKEEEDQGQIGGQASQSGASDHDRHPLIWQWKTNTDIHVSYITTSSSS